MPSSLRKRQLDIEQPADQENISPQTKAPKLNNSSDIRSFLSGQEANNISSDGVRAPKRKTASSRSTIKPSKNTMKATPVSTLKQAQKLYNDTLALVSKKYKALEKGYKINPTIWSGVTSDNVAKAMAKFLPTVEKLLDMEHNEGPKLAFDLLMWIADHAHADHEFSWKMSGWGQTEKPYKDMDQVMLRIIDARLQREGAIASGSSLLNSSPSLSSPVRVPFGANDDASDSDAEVKEFLSRLKGNWPNNKQQRKAFDLLRSERLKGGANKRRLRREKEERWAPLALKDLRHKRKVHMEPYGIGEHFFRESIKRLTVLASA
ncbi:hypothetical protein H2199_003754 [Coniosporium tulheliwenetii]|uniref:Uncharacterized protein n=1 Tax=Coniosporium tulheliwenetii TaxID=3383036 RepID=A0ACC2Z804_9PEZI|nr:hypothetical protein H2199_003754 [Cladosporium sp. JES 115]